MTNDIRDGLSYRLFRTGAQAQPDHVAVDRRRLKRLGDARNYPLRTGAVDGDGIAHKLHRLIRCQALRLQFDTDLRDGDVELAGLAAEAKVVPALARKTISVAPLVPDSDHLISWAGVQSVVRQQPQKLVVRGVSVRDGCRYQHSRGGRHNRTEQIHSHG